MVPTGGWLSLALAAIAGHATGTQSLQQRAKSPQLAHQAYPGPPTHPTSASWSEFCQEHRGQYPEANFNNPLVAHAAQKLSSIPWYSFHIYQPSAQYLGFPVYFDKRLRPDERRLGNNLRLPSGKRISGDAYYVLTSLCAEFRDRPSMIAAKLRWMSTINFVASGAQDSIPNQADPWQSITTEGYKGLLHFSQRLFSARRDAVQSSIDTIGPWEYERAIPPLTFCEVRLILNEYVAKGRPFDQLNRYHRRLARYRHLCTADERSHYVDFRGDSNLKAQSPESNGMVWYALSIHRACTDDRSTRRPLKREKCLEYARQPFTARWNAARAGLGAWLLHHPSLDHDFVNSDWLGPKAYLTTIPHTFGHLRPFDFRLNDRWKKRGYRWELLARGKQGRLDERWPNVWHRPSMGLEALAPEGEVASFLYQRLRDAVDRHADWYQSAYHDQLRDGRRIGQAYSPFVASSHVLASADGFTVPGVTLPAHPQEEANVHRHWMFVFKIRKDRWITPSQLKDRPQVDFDEAWFDETSFGASSLADSEHGLDRMGSPLENELHAILYLQNLSAEEL